MRHAINRDTAAPIRVGLIHALTGHLSFAERSIYQGAVLAIEELNASGGVEGRLLEPLVEDYASDFTRAVDGVQKLVLENGVQIVFGGYTSASRVAMVPVFERHNALLFYGTYYEGLECSPNCVYGGAVPNQFLTTYVPWVLENLGRRIYVVGSDYIYPRTASAIIRRFVIEAGGTMVADRYFPLGTTNFAETMADIRSAQPTVVFSNMVGDSTIAFYQQFAEAGFSAATLPIAATVTTEVEVRAMGASFAAGHYMTATYFQSLDNPANRRFVESYRARWGDNAVTSVTVADMYQCVYLFAKAASSLGLGGPPLPPEQLHGALVGATIDNAPEGVPITILTNHHCNHPSYVGRSNGEGQFDIVATFETRDADPFPPEIVPPGRAPVCPSPLSDQLGPSR